MFQGKFKNFHGRVFERNSKGISMKFQMCFKSVSRKFLVYFEIGLHGVTRRIEGSFSGFQGCLNDIQWKFQ